MRRLPRSAFGLPMILGMFGEIEPAVVAVQVSDSRILGFVGLATPDLPILGHGNAHDSNPAECQRETSTPSVLLLRLADAGHGFTELCELQNLQWL